MSRPTSSSRRASAQQIIDYHSNLDDDYNENEYMGQSIRSLKEKEEELRRLDEELNAKKAQAVKRAEELVREQSEKLHRLPLSSSSSEPRPFDHDYHTALHDLPSSSSSSSSSSSHPTSSSSKPSSIGSRPSSRSNEPVKVLPPSRSIPSIPIQDHNIPTSSTSSSSASSSKASSRSSSRVRSRASSRPSSPPLDNHSTTSSTSRPSQSQDIDDAAAIAMENDIVNSNSSSSSSTSTTSDDVIDTTNMSSASIIRVQKARILSLSNTISQLQSQLLEATKNLENINSSLKTEREKNVKLSKKMTAVENERDRARSEADSNSNKVSGHETVVEALKKDVESRDKIIKQLETDMKNKDIKLTRVLAEIEKLKKTSAIVNAEKKEKGGEQMKEIAKLKQENKRLLMQRNDLLAAFKKQFRLIDVLRKQKLHLEAARLLAFTEDEFAKALELGNADT